ncbi:MULTISPECIES: protein translocase subunit SecD [unclassified Paenibacillus]|uniref:protein translocase subunit SecD n=1 Tax=unclassified Paenibacillus TaxID=185978 RepID=UPI001AE5A52B|nr:MULTISPECIES: protein translocase subunit SecD [unclassified Paenibacillus]MBP1156548.1 SecD/SecF fusion protein [Paenibacillus sp. PvP091]MBP1172714.1 SecD/SecF fusion protein [Paenibacillus sp. PvR098]MBP2439094.1 SecD/SecF fusion protein [Paenibacillus sp. PvP052]
MDIKRIVAFFASIAIVFAVVLWTSPHLVSNIKLGLDLKGGFEILYIAEPIEPGQQVTKESLLETARSIEDRANAQKVSEPEVTTEGRDRIRVRLAGIENETEVREILKKPAELSFRGPDGTKEMVGSDFEVGAAQLGFDETNRPLVNIKVKDPEKFRQVTQKLVGQPLAIYLDEVELSAPIVQQVLTGGTATISGNYTYDEAKKIADTINLGALPLKLTEKYTQSVGASLGQLSLEQTVKASIIASILIVLFMIVYYRVPGIVASITIVTFIWLMLVVTYLMNATLTLPGIAAFVLGVGMAVDANIITYERIREELRSGKSVLSSLKSGSRHSFRTILDANVTTILAGAVLYFLGTGAIQGFALTLIFTILVSILTNVFFSRWLLTLLVRSNIVKKPAYFGVKESEINAL